jgi:hypothetical protein
VTVLARLNQTLLWLIAGALIALAAAAAVSFGLQYRDKKRAEIQAATGTAPAIAPDYTWLARAMDNCERDASGKSGTLTFLVVPLEAAQQFNEKWAGLAVETVGKAALFASKDALETLKAGATRISGEQYVLHTFDSASNSVLKWSSARGVSMLSKEVAGKGPFRIRLQITTDDDPRLWSTVTADGTGTCHWIFAVLRK